MQDISHLKKSKVSQAPNLYKVECLDQICVKPSVAQQPGLCLISFPNDKENGVVMYALLYNFGLFL